MDSQDLKKRYDSLVTQRKTLDDTLEEIEQYVAPFRGGFFEPLKVEQEVRWRRRKIYDSTAIDSAEMLSSSLQGSLTSPSTKWFALGFRDSLLNEEQEAREWIEEVGDRMYQALIDSNFNLESSEFYLDLVSYGTAIIIEEAESEDEWEGISFASAPIRDCQFEMDHKNQILRFYRQYQWTPLQIRDKFGDDTPEMILDRLKATDSNDVRYDILFCVYERRGKEKNPETVLAPKERPYGWKWVLHLDGSQIGEEGGYYEMPAYVARWRKTTGSQWGYSPAFIALSDILTLNKLIEETLESLAKAVNPATLTTQRNMLSDLDLGSGGLTVLKDVDGIKVHESRARFDVGELRIEKLQQSIRAAFRIDQLQMKESPAMTATEVNVRYEAMQRLLGPTLGRLTADYLDPLINRTFKIMLRAGQLPEIPEVVKAMRGELDVEYVGPLPRAQRQEVVQSTQQWVFANMEIAKVNPEILDIIDFDQIGRESALQLGLPAKYLKDKNEVNEVRENRKQQQQAMAQAQQAKEEGDAMEAQGKGLNQIKEAVNG